MLEAETIDSDKGIEISLQGQFERASGFSLSLNISEALQGVTAVIGHSGAGKSSLMRCIAGFEPEAAIALSVDGEIWQNEDTFLPPEKRAVSTVFQEARLFPHLSVMENLRFVTKRFPRAHKVEGLDYSQKNFCLPLDEVIESLSLGKLLDRPTTALSGGETQRVALARALLRPARLWIFDEPLASLDAQARLEIAPYIQMLCQRHDIPVLYITHNLQEVLQIADRTWLLDAGKIRSITSDSELTRQFPSQLSMDEDVGGVLECKWKTYHAEYGLTELVLSQTSIFLPGDIPPSPDANSSIKVFIPARDVSLSLSHIADVSLLNQLPVKILAMEADTPQTRLLTLDCEGQKMLARVTAYSANQLNLETGQKLFALIKTVSLATTEPDHTHA